MEPPKRAASLSLPGGHWQPPDAACEPRRRSHVMVLLGLGLGTLLEWYDFTIYSGLSGVLSPHFFPSHDPLVQALYFWLVFAVAFITRPLGSIIFGHIADHLGRKLSLLISLLGMGLPTVLIGCLPTFQMIGIAAPILLALLRAVQGIALGGEYGTAIVYVFELARPGREGRDSSYIAAMCNTGILVGNLVVMLVVGVCAPAQLELWGWRIPFLVVIVTVVLAYYLRLRMPDTMELLARARLAAADAAGATAAENGASRAPSAAALRDTSKPGAAEGPGAAAPHTVEEELAEMRRRVPLGQLLKHHWLPLALQTVATTFTAAAFYSYTAWLPSHLAKAGVPLLTTQIMLTTSLVALISAILVCGDLCDRGMPVCWVGAATSAAGPAAALALCAAAPHAVGGGAAGLAGTWVLQIVATAWVGFAVCLLPTIGSNAYPPTVRASGYNLGYSLAFGLVGGLSPMAITAISAASPVAERYAVGFWVLAWGVASAIAYLGLLWWCPACNRTAALPILSEHRRPADPAVLSELRGASVTTASATRSRAPSASRNGAPPAAANGSSGGKGTGWPSASGRPGSRSGRPGRWGPLAGGAHSGAAVAAAKVADAEA